MMNETEQFDHHLSLKARAQAVVKLLDIVDFVRTDCLFQIILEKSRNENIPEK